MLLPSTPVFSFESHTLRLAGVAPLNSWTLSAMMYDRHVGAQQHRAQHRRCPAEGPEGLTARHSSSLTSCSRFQLSDFGRLVLKRYVFLVGTGWHGDFLLRGLRKKN